MHSILVAFCTQKEDLWGLLVGSKDVTKFYESMRIHPKQN